MGTALVWFIAGAAIVGVLWRPRNWPEAIWACSGAVLMILCGGLPVSQAARAVARGTDVYLFLAGMMFLSELARRQGVFDWLASLSVSACKGSAARLFLLIYLVGIAVTVFMSNDATAVVLTPAVYAAVQKARTPALPYLFTCAFIANAASFVLPISNPANLVIYGNHVPALMPWIRTFLVPSICSITVTYLALLWIFRSDLNGNVEENHEPMNLSKEGRVAVWGIVGTAAALLCASAFDVKLGLPTLTAASLAVLIATRARARPLKRVIQGISWSVLPLVAGLFVLVEALTRVGVLLDVTKLLHWCGTLPRMAASLLVSFGIGTLSNLTNNLPSGLLVGGALDYMKAPTSLQDAALIGVDLGPNLSVTGSLATVLWLMVLRREGLQVTGWQFFKVGVVVMPTALLVAILAIGWGSH